jgi:hypothetical protein
MKLSYNLDCQDERATQRVETLLADGVLETVARLTITPQRATEIQPKLLADLCEAQVLHVVGDYVKPNTAVFLEQDLKLLREASRTWGPALAQAVGQVEGLCSGIEPCLKRYLVGYLGIDVGTFRTLLESGYAWNHRVTAGTYGTAKIDIYEVCDTYDSFGPYLSGGYGFGGGRYSVHILGEEGGIHAYLRAGLSLTDDRQYRFLMAANRFLTDSFGDLLSGGSKDTHLCQAAEEARLLVRGERAVPIIAPENGPRCRDVVRATERAVAELVAARHADMAALLATTLPGQQGVHGQALRGSSGEAVAAWNGATTGGPDRRSVALERSSQRERCDRNERRGQNHDTAQGGQKGDRALLHARASFPLRAW